jgi:hypothetical protein
MLDVPWIYALWHVLGSQGDDGDEFVNDLAH